MKSKLMVLAAVLAIAGCDDASKTSATAPHQNDISAGAPIAMKQAGKADGIDFTVTKVTTPPNIEYGPKANEGEVFVIVGYKLKNTAAQPLGLMDRPPLSLVDPSGQSYKIDDFLTASAGVDVADQSSFVADINPNIAVEGRAAWKIDKAAFDRKTWRLVVASDPQLVFALQ
ncbi:DUF4352 domain-containing protein [Sphingomonas sp. RS2018]